MTAVRSNFSASHSDLHSYPAWLVVSVTAALSYIAPKLAGLATPNPQTVWPVWPGCAILVAGLLLVRTRVWPVLIPLCFAAFAIADIQAGLPLGSVTWFIPGNTTEVLIAALGLRYSFDGVPRLNSVKALAKYSFFAILLAPLAGAFLNAHGISHDYWTGWRICLLSEVLAFATITPTLLSWVNDGKALLRRPRIVHLEALMLIVSLVLLSYVTFTFPVNRSSPALLYSLVPFLLWSALRFGGLGINTSTIIVTTLSIWAALQGRGPFSSLIPLTDPLSLQVFLVFAAVPFMVLAAVVEERKGAQEELRTNEDKLRLLLDSTAEAIYGIDLDGRCIFCNPTCLRLLGYAHSEELLGKNMHNLIHHSLSDGTQMTAEECPIFWAFRSGKGVHSDDEVLWKADGTNFPAEFWSHPQHRGQEVVGAVVAFIDITERKRAEAKLANVNRRLIEAQEQERARIARELHDDIGQRLSVMAIQLEQLQKDEGVSVEVRGEVREIRQQLIEALNDTQTLSHELHTSKLEYLGIAAAARSFCREFSDQHGVEIEFQSSDLPDAVPLNISLCLFRVLQESLHNAAKHSGVRHFEARLSSIPGQIHLAVRDSGLGFDTEVAKESPGLGLVSMQERLKLLNGVLSIESRPKQGTTINARIPLKPENNSSGAAD